MQDEGSEFAGGPICDMGECLCAEYAGSFRVNRIQIFAK